MMAMMHMKAPASMCKSCKGAGCPTCMSKGGSVAQDEDALEVKGVHAGVPTRDTAGTDKAYATSWAGHAIKANPGRSSELKTPKEEHRRVLGEMRGMKKPHGNYADGGQVQADPQGSQPLVSKEDADKFKQGLDHGPDAWGNLKKAVGYADGGDVEGDKGMDDEIHSALGSELLDAFERKDSKAIMSGIEAVVLSILNKE